MQKPSAHIIRQGAADTMSGATPTAVSQSQPRPVPVTASPATASTRRSRIHDSNVLAEPCAGEPAAQHAIVVLGAFPGRDSVTSKPSMKCSPPICPILSPEPREDREGVEQPVRK